MKAKDKILTTANQLFYENGIRAIGVDTIISKSDVAKATLYKHFPSKNHLVVGYLNNIADMLWAKVDKDTITIIGFFELSINQIKNENSCHCPFVSAIVEFPQQDCEIYKTVRDYKLSVFDLLKNMAERENLKNPQVVANQLILIWHGLFVNRQIFGKDYDTDPVMDLVKILLKNSKK